MTKSERIAQLIEAIRRMRVDLERMPRSSPQTSALFHLRAAEQALHAAQQWLRRIPKEDA